MPDILIIDDDRSICESLQMYLNEEGYAVDTANSGEGGLEKYRETRSRLIILDVRLPYRDGFSVLDELKQIDANVKVIMITAFHDDETIAKAKSKGAFDYIRKPINLSELDSAIYCALNNKPCSSLSEPQPH